MAGRKYLKGGYLANGGQKENEEELDNFMKSSDDLGHDYSESGDIRIIDDEEEFENFLNESFVRRPPKTTSKDSDLRSLPIRPNTAKAYPSSNRQLIVSDSYVNDFRPLRRGVQVRDSSNNVHDTTSRRTICPQTSRYCLKWLEDHSEERFQGRKKPTIRTTMERTRYDNVLENNMSYPSSGRQLLVSDSYVNDFRPLRRGVQVRDSSNNVHDTTSRRTFRPQTSRYCLKWLEDHSEERFQGRKKPTTRTTMERTRNDNVLENTMTIPALLPDHTSEVGNFKTSKNDKQEAIESLPGVKRRHKKHERHIAVPQGKALMFEPLHDEMNTESDRKLDLVKGPKRKWLPTLLPRSPGNDIKGRVEFWRFHHTHPICAVGKLHRRRNASFPETELMWGGDIALYREANLIEAGTQTATLAETLGDVVYPVKLFTIQTPSLRIPLAEFQTSDPDVIDPYPDSAVRVKMSCGHATTPDNLYGYCRSIIHTRERAFVCPLKSCGRECGFVEIQLKACLTCDERNLFEHVLSNVFLEEQDVHKCPSCFEYIEDKSKRRKWFACIYCQRENRKSKYCKTCLQVWKGRDHADCPRKQCRESRKRIITILKECKWKEIDGVWCPSTRACPLCHFMIHHDSNCKRMKCSRCKTDFCFICLAIKPKDSEYYEGCTGVFEKCDIAPIQDTTKW